MNYNSFDFVVFFLCTLALYYTVFKKRQKILILLSNIFFYIMAGPEQLVFLIFSTVISFLSGKYIYFLNDAYQKTQNPIELKHSKKKKAKVVLILCISINLFLLCSVKYYGFLIDNLEALFNLRISNNYTANSLIMPLGISFYTFSITGYLLDVYWKKILPEQNILKFALFTSYFPHIVQGPIARYKTLAPQFDGQKIWDFNQVISGLQLMLWGFFKKMVIADRLNIFVSQIYDNWQNYYGSVLVIATVFYSIQLYADFSGCMDIVTGVSEAMGIKLDKNFDHPYFSKTIPEFWRRWHITLGTWFKDYVYYPISISRPCKKISKTIRRKYGNALARRLTPILPLIAVWFFTGLWHGAEWKYIFWGLFHGSLIILSTVFEPIIIKFSFLLKLNTQVFSWKLLQMLRTFTLCCIGRIFFRAENIEVAFQIIYRIFSKPQLWSLLDGKLYTYGLNRANVNLALVSICILLSVSFLQRKYMLRKLFAQQNIWFRWIILYAAIMSILVFGIYGPGYDANQFVYIKF